MQKANVHPDGGGGGIPPPPGAVIYKPKTLPAHMTRRRHKKRGCSCNRGRCCFTSLCSTLFTLIVIIGIGVLVFWLYVRPKSPHYTVGNVKIIGLDATALAASTKSGTVSTETSFAIEARNPNKKMGYDYTSINVDVGILGLSVGNGDIAPFYQGHENTTFITDDLKSGPLSVIEVTQLGVLSAAQARAVPLDFKVDVKAQVRIGSWKSPKFKIDIRCSTVVNPNAGNTTIGTIGKNCSHKIKFWIF